MELYLAEFIDAVLVYLNFLLSVLYYIINLIKDSEFLQIINARLSETNHAFFYRYFNNIDCGFVAAFSLFMLPITNLRKVFLPVVLVVFGMDFLSLYLSMSVFSLFSGILFPEFILKALITFVALLNPLGFMVAFMGLITMFEPLAELKPIINGVYSRIGTLGSGWRGFIFN